jgi:hypothetical protein
MAARQVGPGGLSNFVPNGAGGHSRRDLAVILIGGAREAGLDDAKHVRATQAGFYISDEFYSLLYDEQDKTDEIEPQQDEPKPEPEAPKTKPRKRAAKKSSGNRAAKNTTKAEE